MFTFDIFFFFTKLLLNFKSQINFHNDARTFKIYLIFWTNLLV